MQPTTPVGPTKIRRASPTDTEPVTRRRTITASAAMQQETLLSRGGAYPTAPATSSNDVVGRELAELGLR